MIVIDLHNRTKNGRLPRCHGAVGKRKNFDVLLQPALPRACPGTRFQGPCREKICELLQIPLANTVAAGDQENDISMIEAAAVVPP